MGVHEVFGFLARTTPKDGRRHPCSISTTRVERRTLHLLPLRGFYQGPRLCGSELVRPNAPYVASLERCMQNVLVTTLLSKSKVPCPSQNVRILPERCEHVRQVLNHSVSSTTFTSVSYRISFSH